METTRNPNRRLVGSLSRNMLVMGIAILSMGRAPAEGTPVAGSPVILHHATPATSELTTWAVNRYRAAGLLLPPTDVTFHSDESGCRGHLGFAQGIGQVDLCVRLAMEPGPQRIVLHELAHRWCDAHLTAERREAFEGMRGLSSWNGNVDWKVRGYEQAAEIIAWGLGDDPLLPLIEGDRDPAALAAAFRLLTGVEPLTEGGTLQR